MTTITRSLQGALLSAGLLLCFAPGSAHASDNSSIGIVRISDGKATSSEIVQTSQTTAGPVLYLSGNPVTDSIRMKRFERQLDRQAACECDECQNGDCDSDGRCKHRRFGYFNPTGGCGEGVQCARRYGMDYAVNPEYFDQRDGKLFSAPGYGVPMAVPLAPNVAYTYNHGWGIPSSRLTPVSRFAPHPMYLRQQQ